MNEIIQTFLTFFTLFAKVFKWVIHKSQLWIFRIRNSKPPLNESRARQIAYSVLSGSIERAISYRNIDSKHLFIAVLRRGTEDEEDDHDYRIYIIEQFGNTYRSIWNSEPLLFSPQFQITDIDGDGCKEVVFIENDFGTGAGSRVMFVYSTYRKQLFQIREFYNWQDAAGPISPQLEVEPETDKDFLEALEHCAVKLGFLQSHVVDFDNPDFAVQRWHAENGRRRDGSVNLYFYNGRPSYGASISASLEIANIFWIAYFKGPLFGYIKSKNQHFIAYSPSWIYNWVKCLAYNGELLWFGIHCDPGFLSFKFNQGRGELNYYTHFKGKELPEVEEIEYYNGILTINGEIKIPVKELRT